MTTKTISGTLAAGYAITPPTTEVSITTTGYVEGNGVTSPPSKLGAYTLVNDGRIKAGASGVYLYSGGYLANGAATITNAQISGSIGVIFGEKAGTVANFGAIQGLGVTDGGAEGNGVILSQGGSVTNGAAKDTGALIAGAAAVAIYGQAGTIANFGTLSGTSSLAGERVVYLDDGGVLTNGSAADTSAYIGGSGAQSLINPVLAKGAAATVVNFGAIEGAASYVYDGSTGALNLYLSTAIDLRAGGKVTNGTPTDTGAYIGGVYGIVIGSSAGTVVNDGAIRSYFYASQYHPPTAYTQGYTDSYFRGVGVSLANGGMVTNGAVNDTKAEIFAAVAGVSVSGAAGTVRNFGTILAEADQTSAGVSLSAGGNVTNGGPTDHTALIQGGLVGVRLAGAGVVTNYGTISGATVGPAVQFLSSADKLVVESGAVFIGQVSGGGGTLDLACGLGSIDQLLDGDVSVHGAIASANFDTFATLEIAGGTQITLDGDGATDAAGTSTLDLLGTLIVTGSLTTAGKVTGAGALSLQGGQTRFDAATSLTVAQVGMAGATTSAIVAANLTYAGAWTQSGGTLSVDAGDKLTLTGIGDSLSGTLAGAGTVAFTGGADTFESLTLSAAHQTITGAAVTLSGIITLDTTLTAATPDLIVAAAGAKLEGGGILLLSNSAGESLHGVSAAARLTNVGDKIEGAGQLGGGVMSLFNDAGATIDGNLAAALTIDTGSRIIENAGVIENTGAGGTVIKSRINNTGTLEALAGTITVSGAVTGAGGVRITAGTADFASTFSENVAFAAASKGTLELAKSQTYAGSISGFSKTGATALDLGDIAFISGTTKATFAGTTASGVLTVTDGTHTSKITLTGDYVDGAFVTKTDGHGGTIVVDTAGTTARPPAIGPAAIPTPFVGAMAGFGATGAGSAIAVAGTIAAERPMLLRPHGAIA
jgi:hypothetical protein